MFENKDKEKRSLINIFGVNETLIKHFLRRQRFDDVKVVGWIARNLNFI